MLQAAPSTAKSLHRPQATGTVLGCWIAEGRTRSSGWAQSRPEPGSSGRGVQYGSALPPGDTHRRPLPSTLQVLASSWASDRGDCDVCTALAHRRPKHAAASSLQEARASHQPPGPVPKPLSPLSTRHRVHSWSSLRPPQLYQQAIQASWLLGAQTWQSHPEARRQTARVSALRSTQLRPRTRTAPALTSGTLIPRSYTAGLLAWVCTRDLIPAAWLPASVVS